MRSVLDLAASPTSHHETSADICIIGAGAAGIYLARQLTRRGVDVVLIEAGPERSVDADTLGFEMGFDSARYAGAVEGRFFGMGGSTSRWGGLLVPHTESDVREEDVSFWAWRRIVDTVRSNASEVLTELGFASGADFEDGAAKLRNERAATALVNARIRILASLHLPFRRKNLLGLLKPCLRSAMPPRVFVGAVATSWQSEPAPSGSRVRTLTAVSRNGNKLVLSARQYVIAAGALESARILLELDSDSGHNVLRNETTVGCGLTDHLSLPIADVADADRERTAALFGPRFEGNWLRTFRLLAAIPNFGAVRGFTHFAFDTGGKGFVFAKKCLQAVQQRHLPSLKLDELFEGAGEVALLGYGRAIHSRLHIPRGTSVQLLLDIEQAPNRQNRLQLGGRRDAFGRRVPHLNWCVSNADMENIETAARSFLSIWPGGDRGLPELLPRMLELNSQKPHDVYHPTGVCRMGNTNDAVVDGDLRVYGIENIYVASTAVLPSAGAANPTFTLLCLAHSLAQHLLKLHRHSFSVDQKSSAVAG